MIDDDLLNRKMCVSGRLLVYLYIFVKIKNFIFEVMVFVGVIIQNIIYNKHYTYINIFLTL